MEESEIKGQLEFDTFNRDYLNRLGSGEAAAERHFDAYFRRLLRLKLRGRVRSHESDDVIQETFLRVIRSVKESRVHDPSRFGAYVSGICDNVILELWRKNQKHPESPDDPPEQIDPGPLPGDGLVDEDRRRKIDQVLRQLPQRDRDILQMIYLDEIQPTEICRRMGVEPDYLRVLHHRAKNRFREMLQ